MNLLEEIFDWARELPAWIQDAISRLAQKPDGLSEQDYKELYQGCLQNAESSEKVLRHFPAKQTINKYGQVLIKSLGHLKNVNRIDPEQVLRFAASGMTVVYGSNGTGKSGYSRVLKHACFSRDKREVILPDISCKELKGSIAEAEFIISTNGI